MRVTPHRWCVVWVVVALVALAVPASAVASGWSDELLPVAPGAIVRDLDMNARGDLLADWTTGADTAMTLGAVTRPAGGVFGTPRVYLAPRPASGLRPWPLASQLSDAGAFVVGWGRNGSDQSYQTGLAGSERLDGRPRLIRGPGGKDFDVDAALAPDGHVTPLWVEKLHGRYGLWTVGKSGRPQLVGQAPVGWIEGVLAAVADANGRVLVLLWVANLAESYPPTYHLEAMQRTVRGVWTAARAVTPEYRYQIIPTAPGAARFFAYKAVSTVPGVGIDVLAGDANGQTITLSELRGDVRRGFGAPQPSVVFAGSASSSEYVNVHLSENAAGAALLTIARYASLEGPIATADVYARDGPGAFATPTALAFTVAVNGPDAIPSVAPNGTMRLAILDGTDVVVDTRTPGGAWAPEVVAHDATRSYLTVPSTSRSDERYAVAYESSAAADVQERAALLEP